MEVEGSQANIWDSVLTIKSVLETVLICIEVIWSKGTNFQL